MAQPKPPSIKTTFGPVTPEQMLTLSEIAGVPAPNASYLNPESEAKAIETELYRRGLPSTYDQPKPPTTPTQPITNTAPQVEDSRAQEEQQLREPKPTEVDNFLLQMERAAKEKERKKQPYIEDQEIGIAQQQRLVDALKNQKAGVNLNPLMALSDTWFGGNLSKGYQQPQTPEELRAGSLSAMGKLQEQKQKLAEFATKGDPMQEYYKFMRAQQKDAGTQGRFNQTFMEKASEEIDNTINKDVFGEGKDSSFTNIEDSYKQMQDAFNSGDGVAVSAAMGAFARLISKEKGVLADKDIERVQPNTLGKMTAQWEKWATDNPGVPLPDSYVKPYRELVERSKQNLIRIKTKELERREAEKSTRPNYGVLFGKDGYGRKSFDGAKKRISEFGKDAGAGTSDPQIESYAKQYGIPYNAAKDILKEQGYNGK